MAERKQMIEPEAYALRIVDVHRGDHGVVPSTRQTDDMGVVGQELGLSIMAHHAVAEHQQSVDPGAEQSIQGAVGVRIDHRVTEQELIAARRKLGGDLRDQRGRKRIGDVRDQHADCPAPLGAQSARHQVGPVAKARRSFQHSLARGVANGYQ